MRFAEVSMQINMPCDGYYIKYSRFGEKSLDRIKLCPLAKQFFFCGFEMELS
jgi:hypothetical protein